MVDPVRVVGDAGGDHRRWSSPLAGNHYDRMPLVLASEQRAIYELGLANLRRRRGYDRHAPQWNVIGRLLAPLDAISSSFSIAPRTQHHLYRGLNDAVAVLLLRCAQTGRSYWSWTSQEWRDLLGDSHDAFRRSVPAWAEGAVRPFLCAHAFLLGNFDAFHRLGYFGRRTLAARLFGEAHVDAEIDRIRRVLAGWGYRCGRRDDSTIPAVASQMFLIARSPHLEDLDTALFDRVRAGSYLTEDGLRGLHPLQRAVAQLGYCDPPQVGSSNNYSVALGVPEGWRRWAERWYQTSTLTPKVRRTTRAILFKVGRWLAVESPDAADPAQWTRQTCAAWVAVVDRMNVGDYNERNVTQRDRIGKPLAAASKAHLLSALRTFFRDCQEWEWLPRRFDPQTALVAPRSIKAMIGPNPRIIADDIWAKLIWAGLNLSTEDVPRSEIGFYPVELVRAIAVTWLFSGLRSDEIARLRVGCVRWQQDGTTIASDSQQVLARDAVCLLDVPVHKTGTVFSKPVDPLLGHAIDAWQAIRPEQPKSTDRRTGETATLLFSFRARAVSSVYINHTIIPMLCRKAGVPAADVRGKITSHRARSTIASQLYNAKEPMTLFELQAWLGHRSPSSTQHYAKISANTLTSAYRDAGYFDRNVRTIEVLVDRDAVTTGAAAGGEPWQYYDLGHGFCTYSFFEQCPHRMACARCDFYAPKASSKGQLLEAKENLQRMLAVIPLTEEEEAAVDDGQAALDRLLDRLADTPTPSGQIPRQLDVPPTATLLPIAEVRQGRSSQP